MHIVLLSICTFILGFILGKNFYFKDSMFSDVDIMLITQEIELFRNESFYEKLKFDWEYVLRTHDENVDCMSKELQKIIDKILNT
jgi:hypothetical protein